MILTQTGVGASAAAVMNLNATPFNVGFGVVLTGSATYTVQHSFDDPASTTGLVTWFDHPTITGKTANADGNYAFPVSAIRINVTADVGKATMTIIQAGPY